MGFKKRPLSSSKRGGGKPKRSKEFWAQRPTINLHQEVDEKELSSSSGSEDEGEVLTEYDALLEAYGANKEDVRSEDEEDESDLGEDEAVQEDEEAVMEDEEDSAEEGPDLEEGDNSEADELGEEESDLGEDNSIELEEEEGECFDLEEANNEPDLADEEEISDQEEEESMEDNADESEGNEEKDKSVVNGPSDPFLYRYELELQAPVLHCLESSKHSLHSINFKSLGRAEFRALNLESNDLQESKDKTLLDGDVDNPTNDGASSNELTLMRKHQVESMQCFSPPKFTSLSQMHIVRRLLNASPDQEWGSFEKDFFSVLSSYKDIYYPQRDSTNADKLRNAYVLHAANHILKSKARITANNAKVKAGAEVRDQGLVRPKVLIIVPFRESARKIINTLKDVLYSSPADISKYVANNARFLEDFGGEDEPPPEKRVKPDDFYETFAGNVDDSFKIGISFGNKGIKLYSEFYSSDIIIASPLGLRIIIGVEGDKERDFDFLNSIEMLIMDQMEVFSMQNWDHVLELMSQLHLKPLKSHGVDFSRVRLWSLNGLHKHYRQSIFLSGIRMPEINSLFNKDCHNFMGRIKINNPIKSGTICRVSGSVSAPMTFRRFTSPELMRSPESRFNFFTSKILPDYTKDSMFHTLIFIPSYFDFVRIRNHFNTSSYDYGEICEYTKDKNIAAARDNFFHNELHFILYTERCHFYRRFRVKGIRHLVFYQLPQNPQFYSELVNFMLFQNRKGGGSDGHMSVTVLYDKYDVHRVSAVTGSDRCTKMYSSEKSTHMFMSNEG